MFHGAFNYQVSALTKNGFKAKSALGQIQFSFKSPGITSPANGTQFTSGKPVLLIWNKTNFAEGYDLEVYSDETLKASVFKERITDNFYSIQNLKPGKYFWRVRSTSKTVNSLFSATGNFVIQ